MEEQFSKFVEEYRKISSVEVSPSEKQKLSKNKTEVVTYHQKLDEVIEKYISNVTFDKENIKMIIDDDAIPLKAKTHFISRIFAGQDEKLEAIGKNYQDQLSKLEYKKHIAERQKIIAMKEAKSAQMLEEYFSKTAR